MTHDYSEDLYLYLKGTYSVDEEAGSLGRKGLKISHVTLKYPVCMCQSILLSILRRFFRCYNL